jgi:zinc/manganese transport system permease protein
MIQRLLEQWWLWPLLMCWVLTGIHGYLGIHVLQRKVIFVDLAMAQIAALGAAYAILLGYEPGRDVVPIYLFSLGFTLAGAAVISLSRMRNERVPHEAFIGIVYASASALAMLVLARAPGEGEHIKHMLVGNLIVVTKGKVLVTAVIYAAILAFHGFFREKFFLISSDPAAAEKAGVSVRLWDFLFYLSFGVVITSSVSVAGVLLVFSFLVVPAVIAVMFAEQTRRRIAIAWGLGGAVSVAGLFLSYYGSFPTGPSVVASFTVALLVAGAVHYVVSHERSGMAAGRLASALAAVALLVWGTSFLRKAPDHHEHAHEDDFSRLVAALHSDNETLQLEAIHHLEEAKDPHAAPHLITTLKDPKTSDRILEHLAEALAVLGAADAVPALLETAKRDDLDPFLRVTIAKAVLDLKSPLGFAVLLDVLEKESISLPREEAKKLLEERAGVKTDYATDRDPTDNLPAMAKLKAWWAERGSRLRWREPTRRFE